MARSTIPQTQQSLLGESTTTPTPVVDPVQSLTEPVTRLNKEQQLAVTTIDGPVMIIAGPGTGKTTVLSERIAHILQSTDSKPQTILAITYTEAGVSAMRQKLVKRIGNDAYQVEISTIHGFCNSVLQQYSMFFPEMDEAVPLNDLERLQLILHILEEGSYTHLKPLRAPEQYLREISSSLSLLKREGVTPERMAELIEEEKEKLSTIRKFTRNKTLTREYQSQDNLVKRLTELQQMFVEYQKRLPELKRYDYEDMIGVVYTKMQDNSELKLTLQERFQYFLVDEYQDTNNAQNNLIFALADYWGEQANIFVVGDDAQSIYRFQGASLENFYSFHQRYPQATIITLKENYRSSQLILDASYQVIQKNSSGLEKLLPGVNKQLHAASAIDSQSFVIDVFPGGLAESLHLADRLKELHEQGTPWEEMAVIIRQHRDFDFFREVLLRQRIPYVKPSGENALHNISVRQLLDLLRLVESIPVSPNDDVLLFSALHFECVPVPRLDVLKLTRFASRNKLNFWEALLHLQQSTEQTVEMPSKEGLEAMQKFVDQLNEWYALSMNVTLAKLFEAVLNESGLLDFILTLPDKYEHLNALQSFFEEVRALNETNHDIELSHFLNDIAVMERYGLTIKEKNLQGKIPGVAILTAHSAKGLEFDYVFMPRTIDKNWGNRMNRELIKMPTGIISPQAVDKMEKNEEERRLFFVALTRARKGLWITSAEEYTDRFGKTQSAQPSQFINEIPDRFKTQSDKVPRETKGVEELVHLLQKPSNSRFYVNSVDSEQFLRKVIGRMSLSPTALNTYLECPYKFLLESVLRIPRIPDPALAFGTAIHKGLEVYMRSYQAKKAEPATDLAIEAFTHSLQKELLRTSQAKEYHATGVRILTDYIQNYRGTFPVPLFVEYNGGGQPRLYRDVRLSGKIDRIEPVENGSSFLNLVDYKTGRAKSRTQLLGQDAEGLRGLTPAKKNYNQLLFYKVLLDLDPWFSTKGYTVVSGTLDYVEGDHQKHFVRHSFEYKDAEVNDFKDLIVETWQKIDKHQFDCPDASDECPHCSWSRTNSYRK